MVFLSDSGGLGQEFPVKAGKMARTTVQGEAFGEYHWKKFMPLAFGGHCYYVRQDLTGDQWDDNVMDRELDGIAIPNSAADRCQFVTVLGIGPRVGMQPSKEHQTEYGWADGFGLISDVKVGDRLLIAQEPGTYTNRLKRSPLNWNEEAFIEESLPDAIVEE